MLRMFILARPTRAGSREGLPDLVEMTRVTGGRTAGAERVVEDGP